MILLDFPVVLEFNPFPSETSWNTLLTGYFQQQRVKYSNVKNINYKSVDRNSSWVILSPDLITSELHSLHNYKPLAEKLRYNSIKILQ